MVAGFGLVCLVVWVGVFGGFAADWRLKVPRSSNFPSLKNIP